MSTAVVETNRDKTTVYTPAVDIYENENSFVLYADIPGADEKSVEITVEKDQLSIQAKVNDEVPVGSKLRYSEYGIGDYKRSFSLGDRIDREKIEASVKNGVLKLVLPRIEPVVRKIEIRTEN
ncbi:MAG: Hsp20/alpha crystallin family protein [Leptonema sp. (in: Bacteria)]|nr:Hsp20/alpha crystallin family protein [Leptonema sp. (in: bacteria)]